VPLTHQTSAVRTAEKRLAKRLTAALKALGKSIAKDVAKHMKLGKAEAEEDEADAAVARADWEPIAKAADSDLSLVARDGAKRALAAVGIEDDESITEQTFTSAANWARARAAELVGKSWDEDGALVDNPEANMAITDTIREEIRSAVADAIESGDSAAELGDRIEALAGFSASRADMIARTEIIRSHAQGQMAAMRESGVVEQKAWSTAGEEVCDECQDNEDEGAIDLEDDFPSGDDAPPAHPGCRCAVVAVIPEAQGEEEGSSEDDEESDEAAE
jgi:SPP1 gp7 family putative phage head morphogenesis protein